jgi:CheY-like chemotaxis protein
VAEFPDLKVLLVEDEGTVALLLEDMLEDFGCQLIASLARVGPALETVNNHPIELAILDVNVAGETSFDLARSLAARGVPFVFSTGYGNGGLPDDLTDRPVLTKPFSSSDLRSAIKDALDDQS